MQIRHVNAPDAPAPSGQFTHAVEVTGASRTVYISGQVGSAMDGSIPEDATAQGRLVWHNIQAQLDDAPGQSPTTGLSQTTLISAAADFRSAHYNASDTDEFVFFQS